MTWLYHVSEQPDIQRFDPRPAAGVTQPVVWAINQERLRNYLLPRDCPRVTFFAGENTSKSDRDQFLGDSHAVVAIECAWFERARQTRLFCYRLPDDTFRSVDSCAGYFHSTASVTPIDVEVIDDPLLELVNRGVELRVLPSLWALRDAVAASTLSFSIIRMRNAAPRPVH